ncbi:MAG: hypothetical protein AAGL99_06305 [Pseudomonadota bacterium]
MAEFEPILSPPLERRLPNEVWGGVTMALVAMNPIVHFLGYRMTHEVMNPGLIVFHALFAVFLVFRVVSGPFSRGKIIRVNIVWSAFVLVLLLGLALLGMDNPVALVALIGFIFLGLLSSDYWLFVPITFIAYFAYNIGLVRYVLFKVDPRGLKRSVSQR